MADEAPLRGVRREEIRVIIKLLPVFRRYLRDRRKARNRPEGEWDPKLEANARKAVKAFIELGPTFIKLGQIISARPDLMPNEYMVPFQDLQDRVDPAPFPEVEKVLKESLGDKYSLLQDFNREAISGASLGQVYTAKFSGRDVAVKVVRPGVERLLRRDLAVLKRLLRLARKRMENFLYLSISNVVEDFSYRVFDEVDYLKEASNMERIAHNIDGREKVVIPSVVRDLTTKDVLTMDLISGIKITDVQGLKDAGIDLKSLAYRLDLIFIRMLLKDDIFHADPHPGNVSVTNEGKIILYDFGMVGTLDAGTKFDLLSLYMGMLESDPDVIIDALLDMNALSPAANRGVIRKSIEMTMAGLRGVRMETREMQEILEIANNVIFEFPFRLPRSLVLYMRMSSLLEGICRQLDPDFRFIAVLSQILYREGELQQLYAFQLSRFAKKAVQSIEKGLDVLPLLKRRLENQEEPQKNMADRRTPAAVFMGFVFLASVYVLSLNLVYGVLMASADLAGFAALMLSR